MEYLIMLRKPRSSWLTPQCRASSIKPRINFALPVPRHSLPLPYAKKKKKSCGKFAGSWEVEFRRRKRFYLHIDIPPSRWDSGIPRDYCSSTDYKHWFPWGTWMLWRVDSKSLYPNVVPVLPRVHPPNLHKFPNLDVATIPLYPLLVAGDLAILLPRATSK